MQFVNTVLLGIFICVWGSCRIGGCRGWHGSGTSRRQICGLFALHLGRPPGLGARQRPQLEDDPARSQDAPLSLSNLFHPARLRRPARRGGERTGGTRAERGGGGEGGAEGGKRGLMRLDDLLIAGKFVSWNDTSRLPIIDFDHIVRDIYYIYTRSHIVFAHKNTCSRAHTRFRALARCFVSIIYWMKIIIGDFACCLLNQLLSCVFVDDVGGKASECGRGGARGAGNELVFGARAQV